MESQNVCFKLAVQLFLVFHVAVSLGAAQSYSVSFSMSTFTVGEGDFVALPTVDVVVTGSPSRDGVVNLVSTDGMAVNGMDYSLSSPTLTISPTTSSLQAAVNIHEDSLVEADETFTLSLSSMDSLVVIGSPSQITVTIEDNDGMNTDPPTIRTSPDSRSTLEVFVNSLLTLLTAATGEQLSFQWFKDGVNLTDGPGITIENSDSRSSLTINITSVAVGGEYGTIVSNPYGSATSNITTVIVVEAVVDPPTIRTSPDSRSSLAVFVNNLLTLQISATGEQLSFQWFKDGVNLTDGPGIIIRSFDSQSSLTINIISVVAGGEYGTIVSNPGGSVTSNITTVIVAAPPIITTHPSSVFDVPEGSDVSFVVVAIGYDLSYQWRKDDMNVTRDGTKYEGAESANFTVRTVNGNDEGKYDCFVYNSFGHVTSMEASLTVVGGASVVSLGSVVAVVVGLLAVVLVS